MSVMPLGFQLLSLPEECRSSAATNEATNECRTTLYLGTMGLHRCNHTMLRELSSAQYACNVRTVWVRAKPLHN